MTPKAAKSEHAPTPNTATDDSRELTPNELATIHGGSVALTYARISFPYQEQKPDGTL